MYYLNNEVLIKGSMVYKPKVNLYLMKKIIIKYDFEHFQNKIQANSKHVL